MITKGPFAQLANRPPRNIPALDFLRSCAILLVFTLHTNNAFVAPSWFARLPITHYGWSGVDLFFVLSGLLIGIQLWGEARKTGNIRIGRFLLRRGLRIWPLYAAVVLMIAFEVVLRGRTGAGLWADAVYISNYYTPHQISGSWSLSTEEQFYLITPVCLWLGIRFVALERLWVLPAIAPLLLIAARFFTVLRHPALTVGEQDQVLYFPLHTHADGLAIGLLIGWIAVIRPDWIRSVRFCRFAAAGAIAAGLLLYAVNPILTNFTALALIFGALALVGLGDQRLPAVINWHGFYILSRLSYGIYLNHFGVIGLLGKWPKPNGSTTFFLYYFLCLALSIILAFITFALIEWPFLSLRDRWLSHASVRTSPSSATGEVNARLRPIMDSNGVVSE